MATERDQRQTLPAEPLADSPMTSTSTCPSIPLSRGSGSHTRWSQTYSASNPTRGTGRAIWIVGIGADLDNPPEAARLGAAGVERGGSSDRPNLRARGHCPLAFGVVFPPVRSGCPGMAIADSATGPSTPKVHANYATV